jgi:hypothetical protein
MSENVGRTRNAGRAPTITQCVVRCNGRGEGGGESCIRPFLHEIFYSRIGSWGARMWDIIESFGGAYV